MRQTLEHGIDILVGIMTSMAAFAENNAGAIQYVLGIVAIAAAVYMVWTAFKIGRWAVRSVLRTVVSIRWTLRRWSHRANKNRVFRALKGKFMAKWKIGELGSAIDDLIFERELAGRLSDQEGKRLRKQIGEAIGDFQLIPRRFNKMFLRHYFLGSKDPKTGKVTQPVYQKLAGPKKETFKGAGGPPELHIPSVEGSNVSSELLNRLKKTA